MANKSQKVVVKTNDGKEHETTVENYNAKEIVDLLNDQSNTLVAIGDMVIHRSFVTGVKPIEK